MTDMKVHLPAYLGGDEVELETDGLTVDESIIGWIDEYGTIISSKANIRIGDIINTNGTNWSALVMMNV